MPMTTRSFETPESDDGIEVRAPQGSKLDPEDVVQAECEVPDYPADRDPHNGGVDQRGET